MPVLNAKPAPAGYCGRLEQQTHDQGNSASSPSFWTVCQAWCGSFIGILSLSMLDWVCKLENSDKVLIVGSFGAQAVLLFAAPRAPLAQPWNCVFGNLLGSSIGVSCYKISAAIGFDDPDTFVASAFATSLAIAAMLLTKSLHPPAGASALIAVQGSDRIHALGYWYVLFPCVLCSILHVLIAFLWNNTSMQANFRYPLYWRPYKHGSGSSSTLNPETP